MLVCLCLQAIPAQCAEIFFNHSTANRLYVDLQFAKKASDDNTTRLTLCNKDRTLLEDKAGLLSLKLQGRTEDAKVYKLESERFQALYVGADQERIKAVNNAPSRLRWFAAGVLATLATVVAGFVVAR